MFTLYPHQAAAVRHFHSTPRGSLVRLPAGSGKSLVLYQIAKDLSGPILVCSCSYILYEHISNIANFLPTWSHQLIKTGKDKIEYLSDKSFLFVTPSILSGLLGEVARLGFKLLCFDESHMYANLTAKRTKSMMLLGECHPAKKLLLTATPCPEHVGQLYPQIRIIDVRSGLGSPAQFNRAHRRKYTILKKAGGAFCKYYYVNTERITRLCAPYIFEYPREKITLPKQQRRSILLEMPAKTRKVYDSLVEKCYAILEENVMLVVTAGLWIKLLQVCAGVIKKENGETSIISKDKAKMIARMCADLECSVLVWGSFRGEIKLLGETIKDSQTLMGGTKNAAQIIQDFKDKKFKVLISHRACIGAGVSLQVAGAQISSSLTPSACLDAQAEARTNRINQTQNVTVYDILYKDTVEEILCRKVQGKQQKQENIIRDVLNELLKKGQQHD